MKNKVILILVLLFIVSGCTGFEKEKVGIKINENEYVTIGNWNVMLKEIFEYSGTIRADLDIFSGKPIEGYETPKTVSPKPDFQGYEIGDELNLENNIYFIVDIKKTENEQGYVILKKADGG